MPPARTTSDTITITYEASLGGDLDEDLQRRTRLGAMRIAIAAQTPGAIAPGTIDDETFVPRQEFEEALEDGHAHFDEEFIPFCRSHQPGERVQGTSLHDTRVAFGSYALILDAAVPASHDLRVRADAQANTNPSDDRFFFFLGAA
ncbi:hypothetical protein BDV93DRAFT_563906 [Ceratobasidium sp. AG-I]|nr:hypothetical protein BDV93DRAFT_563906 [Ceratobasidium sp. AG-I]